MFGHQKILASAVILVKPAWPKCKMSSSRLRRSTGTTIWSSINISPHRMESFPNTGLYPSGVASLSSRLMLILTLLSSGSMAVLAIRVFKSTMNSNSAFFIVCSIIFCFRILLSHNMIYLNEVGLFSFCVELAQVHYWQVVPSQDYAVFLCLRPFGFVFAFFCILGLSCFFD